MAAWWCWDLNFLLLLPPFSAVSQYWNVPSPQQTTPPFWLVRLHILFVTQHFLLAASQVWQDSPQGVWSYECMIRRLSILPHCLLIYTAYGFQKNVISCILLSKSSKSKTKFLDEPEEHVRVLENRTLPKSQFSSVGSKSTNTGSHLLTLILIINKVVCK